MHSSTIAAVLFACVFGGALLGLWLGARLPAHHVDGRTQELVKLGMGTVATLMALVLGLLVATAKASFDTTTTQTKEFSAKLVVLDHLLVRYGPETAHARRLLRQFLALKIAQMWPERGHPPPPLQTSSAGLLLDSASDQVLALSPHDAQQKLLKTRALQIAVDVSQTRWLLIEHTSGSSIPAPFLIVLGFWGTILFVSFGMFAPRHATAIAVLLVCALSIAAAIFIILELDHPFGGLIRISSAPVRNALANMH